MGYLVENIEKDKVSFVVLKNSDTGEYVKIATSHGAAVVQAALSLDGRIIDILSPDSDGDFLLNPLFRGRMLFPFNDRIPDAKYVFGGRSFELPVNSDDGSAIHGLIYNKPVMITDSVTGDSFASVTLLSSISSDQYDGYPFDVELQITCTLSGGGLEFLFDVHNSGSCDAPYALGWHPYFTTEAGSQIQGRFKSYVDVDENLLPTGSNIDIKDSEYNFTEGWSLTNRKLDLGFTAVDGVTVLKRPGFALKMVQDVLFFPYTQMYIPDDGESVALEPVTAVTNSFNNPELGLRILSPGEHQSGKVILLLENL